MKRVDKKEALSRLEKIKTAYRNKIRHDYETKAKDCLTCQTKGACCLDAHFVNVHITRLEAAALNTVLRQLPAARQVEIARRISETIERYNLTDSGDTFSQTFACPLFEGETGCLVHGVKPVPCIQHACYERPDDLPPDDLQEEIERKIERLNRQTFGNTDWLPLPIALKRD
jgi:hypothetical protein